VDTETDPKAENAFLKDMLDRYQQELATATFRAVAAETALAHLTAQHEQCGVTPAAP
jgi:hypothetical protein